jgi:hypothetical protein
LGFTAGGFLEKGKRRKSIISDGSMLEYCEELQGCSYCSRITLLRALSFCEIDRRPALISNQVNSANNNSHPY